MKVVKKVIIEKLTEVKCESKREDSALRHCLGNQGTAPGAPAREPVDPDHLPVEPNTWLAAAKTPVGRQLQRPPVGTGSNPKEPSIAS